MKSRKNNNGNALLFMLDGAVSEALNISNEQYNEIIAWMPEEEAVFVIESVVEWLIVDESTSVIEREKLKADFQEAIEVFYGYLQTFLEKDDI